MGKREIAETHDMRELSQFKLSKIVLNNLSNFKITPTAKLVLLYLVDCYNPGKADIFPKQKTIAKKLGISERSIVRAIQELFKEGLILIECKYTNRYKFTSKINCEPSQNKKICNDKMSDDLGQIVTKEDDKLSPHEHITMNNKINTVELDILKRYAEGKNARNENAYIQSLIKSGSYVKILEAAKIKEKNKRISEKLQAKTKEIARNNKEYSEVAEIYTNSSAWENFGKKWGLKR